jgi:AmiR/NasT family two-component response regulator
MTREQLLQLVKQQARARLIGQAEGVLMERLGLTTGEAQEWLISAAEERSCSVDDVALALVQPHDAVIDLTEVRARD